MHIVNIRAVALLASLKMEGTIKQRSLKPQVKLDMYIRIKTAKFLLAHPYAVSSHSIRQCKGEKTLFLTV